MAPEPAQLLCPGGRRRARSNRRSRSLARGRSWPARSDLSGPAFFAPGEASAAAPRVTLAPMATLRSETSRGTCGAFVMDSPAEDDLVVRMPAPAHPPARPRPDTGVRKSLMRTRASAGACEGEQS